MCLLVIVVGFAPTLQQRLAAIPGQNTGRAAAPDPGAAREGEGAAPAVSGETLLFPLAGSTGEIPLPDAERIVEQAQLIRGELAARERAIAAQEDLLRRQVLAEFWKRQAAAAAATLGLSLIIVLLLVRRAAAWSGFAQRLRAEESRLRNLQLSVIGALEEFESELAAARSWAAAEARSRRPAADRSAGPDPAELPMEPVVFGAGPAPIAPGSSSARPALARETPGPISGGFFFGEDEHVGTAVPMESGDERRTTGEPGAPRSFPAPPVARGAEASPVVAFQGFQGPHEHVEPPSWARRFLAPEASGDPSLAGPTAPAASVASGPWTEPVRREGPTPGPRNIRPYAEGGPSTREQVERLTAEGWSETEIARRLGLSREEIHLALMLGRSARAETLPSSPYGRGPGAGHALTTPPPGWQPRDRAPEGIVGR